MLLIFVFTFASDNSVKHKSKLSERYDSSRFRRRLYNGKNGGCR